ncbi:MAG: hypothetical protein ACOCZV_02455 [Nanoarchaeota archaeon]
MGYDIENRLQLYADTLDHEFYSIIIDGINEHLTDDDSQVDFSNLSSTEAREKFINHLTDNFSQRAGEVFEKLSSDDVKDYLKLHHHRLVSQLATNVHSHIVEKKHDANTQNLSQLASDLIENSRKEMLEQYFRKKE